MDSNNFDVIIIGAGPAGSTCALALQNTNLRVLLIDKSTFPRDKICGDAVAAYVPKVLNTINPELKEKFLNFSKKFPVDTIRIVGSKNRNMDLAFNEVGCITKRVELDNFLLEETKKLDNVTVQTGCKVNSIEKTKEGFLVKTQLGDYHSKMIVGCDGAQGLSRKSLSPIPKDSAHYAGAVRAYYKGVKGIPTSTFEIHFLKDLIPGYFWIFPLPNGESNIGLGMKTSAIADGKVNLKQEMINLIENYPGIKERFEGAEPISEIQGYGLPLGSRKVPLSGEGFMFCGDAGCLIEPLTGEGIGQAMISGRYAGWQIKECFEKNDFSAQTMLQYDKVVYDKLWLEHKRRLQVRKMIEKFPGMIDFCIGLLEKFPFLNKALKKAFW